MPINYRNENMSEYLSISDEDAPAFACQSLLHLIGAFSDGDSSMFFLLAYCRSRGSRQR